MRQRKRLILALIAVVSLVLVLGFVDWTSGAEEARQGIERGHLELRGYGLPAPWVPDYARLLNSRLGVQFKPVAGCMVSHRLAKRTNEYNQVMTHEIERRYGAGILDRLADEASKAYAATRPSA